MAARRSSARALSSPEHGVKVRKVVDGVTKKHDVIEVATGLAATDRIIESPSDGLSDGIRCVW
jgi:hypothetical protein